MAAIDDKVHALEFRTTTTKSKAQVRQLLDDAAQVAQGEKITLSDSTENLVEGVARNFARIQHAAFSFTFTTDSQETLSVEFRVPDYLRTRETLLYFIPISPWSAPAYKTLKQFSEYVQDGL